MQFSKKNIRAHGLGHDESFMAIMTHMATCGEKFEWEEVINVKMDYFREAELSISCLFELCLVIRLGVRLWWLHSYRHQGASSQGNVL